MKFQIRFVKTLNFIYTVNIYGVFVIHAYQLYNRTISCQLRIVTELSMRVVSIHRNIFSSVI